VTFFSHPNLNFPFSDIKTITIRGEIVLKNKNLSNTAPASIVAGKINGSLEIWLSYVKNIEFISFEIIRVISDDGVNFVPNKIDIIEMLIRMNL
jgi:hypothetical protein